MGHPVSASVVYDDGSARLFEDIQTALRESENGRVEFHYHYGPHALPSPRAGQFDVWRYRFLLPIDDAPITHPLPVGGTPLLAPPELRRAIGLSNLWLKDETRGPTGSNKDRATALALQDAMAAGVRTVTCASTGNVAVSLAVGAASAGLRAVVFVPADVFETKLTLMLAAGATVVKVREGYEAAFRLSRRAAAAFHWYDRNTGVNPLTVEAKKTIALEIWEQLSREVPDVVVTPVGDGPTLNGIAKGFRELVACGAARTVPRLVGVQAEGCQPVKRAWETGAPIEPVQPSTVADGIAVGAPISGAVALRDVRESGGGFVSVSDDEILSAMGLLATKAGVLAEPAGATAVAGLPHAVTRGLIGRDERVVALVTGSALKAPRFLRAVTTPLEVHADLDELRKALLGRA